MVTSCTKAFSAGEACKSWTRCLPANHGSELLSHYLLLDLFCPTGVPKDYINKADAFSSALSRKFTLDELITGLGKSMLFQNISNSAFGICFNFSREANVSKNLIPRCLSVQPALVDSNFTVMSLSHVIFLNSLLPSELRDKWRFLFSSSTHGESFSKCLSCIQEKGATILILKDDRGRIFGGFAPLSWKLGPKFFGKVRCITLNFAFILKHYVFYLNVSRNFRGISVPLGSILCRVLCNELQWEFPIHQHSAKNFAQRSCKKNNQFSRTTGQTLWGFWLNFVGHGRNTGIFCIVDRLWVWKGGLQPFLHNL